MGCSVSDVTVIHGYISHVEFKENYGPELARKELVVLHERDGEHMWKKEADGWYRLQGEPSG